MGDDNRNEPPADVMAWVRETYKPEGVDIWLRAWRNADPAKREHMESMAYIDPMGL